jgi:hypothetical protein
MTIKGYADPILERAHHAPPRVRIFRAYSAQITGFGVAVSASGPVICAYSNTGFQRKPVNMRNRAAGTISAGFEVRKFREYSAHIVRGWIARRKGATTLKQADTDRSPWCVKVIIQACACC